MELVPGNILPNYRFDEMKSLVDEGFADIRSIISHHITKSDLKNANIFVFRKLP